MLIRRILCKKSMMQSLQHQPFVWHVWNNHIMIVMVHAVYSHLSPRAWYISDSAQLFGIYLVQTAKQILIITQNVPTRDAHCTHCHSMHQLSNDKCKTVSFKSSNNSQLLVINIQGITNASLLTVHNLLFDT